MWEQIGAALCLVLVIEGLLPFLFPARWRTLAESLRTVDDKTIRLVGFASMMLGASLLYLVKSS
ncbi:MAG: DUF2065 domain-containing protein [Gammaproteobacteria bacterium]|jgi:hypothetical protein|nr:DUF2065 domain-containing protein [Gammaproteobacteria bacterium]MCS5571228.1 DUF2065 domain-containing protein [Pseudomonadales bacterium]MEC9240757.1 DUF2065 domain-containing protein [Pseudomonadota bacterium]MED5555566.1 DUF2065 domain-containing protein [Pseudomonadota bacterium]MEE3133306.1 DUF2065 domain-containing protein [Pseudomonadota bacterium]|tara:strand:+ start:603 stop:794 length:192 start_codon:yes stop_codon:yes gene_type:complete